MRDRAGDDSIGGMRLATGSDTGIKGGVTSLSITNNQRLCVNAGRRHIQARPTTITAMHVAASALLISVCTSKSIEVRLRTVAVVNVSGSHFPARCRAGECELSAAILQPMSPRTSWQERHP